MRVTLRQYSKIPSKFEILKLLESSFYLVGEFLDLILCEKLTLLNMMMDAMRQKLVMWLTLGASPQEAPVQETERYKVKYVRGRANASKSKKQTKLK